MIIQQLNWLAVILSAIVYFALGALWFNRNVFGTLWIKGHNLTIMEEDKKNMGKIMAMTLVLCFIGAATMGYFTYAVNSLHAGLPTWYRGMKIGAIAGVGFSGVGIAMSYMYTKKSLTVIIIDSAYHIVGMMVSGIIFSVWR